MQIRRMLWKALYKRAFQASQPLRTSETILSESQMETLEGRLYRQENTDRLLTEISDNFSHLLCFDTKQ